MTIAVTYTRPGNPADVLDVTDTSAPPPPGPGQIQVHVTAFPIHPGDLAAIATLHPGHGQPIVAGIEATGIVESTGPGVSDFTLGARVTFFPHLGSWAQTVNVDASLAAAVPDALSDDVAAQMVGNPLTVLMMRRAAQGHFSTGFDGVILNNAAASSVGRLFTASTEHHRIATISIVRSGERAEQLRNRFPAVPVVSTSAPDWPDKVRDAASGRPIPIAFDPVGGAASPALLALLSPGGTLYAYGQLGTGNISIHASAILNEEKSIRGISIVRWLATVSTEQRTSDLASAVLLAQHAGQHFDMAAAYPINQIREAVRAVTAPGKTGTILVKP
jgi:NADPH:quinone reductase-like Zn-dependent oxidoreductase